MTVKVKDYAIYKGDQFLFIGTMAECAEFLSVSIDTIRFYLTPAYAKRVKRRKRSDKALVVFCIDDE